MEAGSPQLVSVKKAPPSPAIRPRSGAGEAPALLSGSTRASLQTSAEISYPRNSAQGSAGALAPPQAVSYSSGPPQASARNSAAAGDYADSQLMTMSSPNLG